MGIQVDPPKATFYIWAEAPTGYSSAETIKKIIHESAIVATPGTAFGKFGEGYIRFALSVPQPRLEQALDRLAKIHW